MDCPRTWPAHTRPPVGRWRHPAGRRASLPAPAPAHCWLACRRRARRRCWCQQPQSYLQNHARACMATCLQLHGSPVLPTRTDDRARRQAGACKDKAGWRLRPRCGPHMVKAIGVRGTAGCHGARRAQGRGQPLSRHIARNVACSRQRPNLALTHSARTCSAPTARRTCRYHRSTACCSCWMGPATWRG